MNERPIMILNTHSKSSGFTLVEMAIVLAIVALLLGGLLPVISGQIEQQRRNETRKYMDEVRDALLGYAISHKYLPCPDKNDDGTAELTCSALATQQFGTLPYNDLGVSSKDAYGSVLVYAVNKDFASSAVPFTLTTNLTTTTAMQICSTDSCTPPHLTSSAVAVIISKGANWGITPPIGSGEAENINGPTTGDYNFVSHDFVQYGFDDLVIWLSPNTLINRMVAAGQLP